MNPTEYLQASERTEKKFEDGMELSPENQIILRYLTKDLHDIGEAMDHMKKHLIYGANCEISAPISDFAPLAKHLDQRQAEFLHHALGKVTEAVELYDAIIEHILKGGDLDETNVFEEIFDSHWYDAGLLRLLGRTFEEGWDTNIAKLQARYPDKFTEDAALKRDIASERAILEEGHSV